MRIFILLALSVFIYACGGGSGDGSVNTISPPVVSAGSDQFVAVGTLVTLDPQLKAWTDLNSVTYNWSITSRPTGSVAALSDSATENPTFTTDMRGEYVLRLIASENGVNSSPSSVTITSATGISGIVASDTTLNLVNSPYVIGSDVQIAYGSTLTIEPGVVIYGNQNSIKVFGIFDAIGTANEKITFNNVNIKPGNGLSYELFKINIDYAEVNSGSIYSTTGNYIYGSISLRNSILTDVAFMYLWYPLEDCFIERNIFINSGGISVGTRDFVNVYIRNNVFYGYTGSGYTIYAIENWAGSVGSTIVEYNSFLNTDRITLILPSGYNTATMTATNNYWNTTDTTVIDSMIYDKNDDLSIPNYIIYAPFLMTHHINTPDSTPYIP